MPNNDKRSDHDEQHFTIHVTHSQYTCGLFHGMEVKITKSMMALHIWGNITVHYWTSHAWAGVINDSSALILRGWQRPQLIIVFRWAKCFGKELIDIKCIKSLWKAQASTERYCLLAADRDIAEILTLSCYKNSKFLHFHRLWKDPHSQLVSNISSGERSI